MIFSALAKAEAVVRKSLAAIAEVEGEAELYQFSKNFGLWTYNPLAAVAKGEKPSATAVDLRPSVDR